MRREQIFQPLEPAPPDDGFPDGPPDDGDHDRPDIPGMPDHVLNEQRRLLLKAAKGHAAQFTRTVSVTNSIHSNMLASSLFLGGVILNSLLKSGPVSAPSPSTELVPNPEILLWVLILLLVSALLTSSVLYARSGRVVRVEEALCQMFELYNQGAPLTDPEHKANERRTTSARVSRPCGIISTVNCSTRCGPVTTTRSGHEVSCCGSMLVQATAVLLLFVGIICELPALATVDHCKTKISLPTTFGVLLVMLGAVLMGDANPRRDQAATRVQQVVMWLGTFRVVPKKGRY